MAVETNPAVTTVAAALRTSGLPQLEARALLATVLQCRREQLIAHPEWTVAHDDLTRFNALVAQRRVGVPLAYLLGEKEFFGRTFHVTDAVLVPRPETETLVEAAVARLADVRSPRVLDLGTGSGCIAVSIALARPDAEVIAVDLSSDALAVARANAGRLGATVEFLRSDWYATVEGSFDLIVANPPYVPQDDPHCAQLRHEPRAALVAGADGLACLQPIIAGSMLRLRDGGWLLVEHGYDQADAVRQLFSAAGFSEIAGQADAAGQPRVAAGRRREAAAG